MTTSYPLHKIKVVLLENIHPLAVERFEKAGYTVELHDRAYNGDELIEVAGDASIIGIRSKTHLTAEFFAAAKRLWGVGCFCIGTNQVDLGEAASRGIPVFNAPYQNTRSVAELVISEIVILYRKLFDRSSLMHQGKWRKSAKGSHEIRGRTLGIVGYGRIGSQVSVLAEAMGLNVLYYDVLDVLPLGNARQAGSLEELLGASDVVTLHVPANPTTHMMITAERLAQMKPGAFLLNNARGTVVDIEALAAALKSGHVGGAAVDVFPKEPSSNAEPFESPLQGLENVILTPHIGGSTIEAQMNIAESASARLVKMMNNGTTATAVNVPEVALPRLREEDHRLLYFHRNVPGVLSKLNAIFAEHAVNISAQFSQSNQALAYAIVDFTTNDAAEEIALMEAVEAIPQTIRARVLW